MNRQRACWFSGGGEAVQRHRFQDVFGPIPQVKFRPFRNMGRIVDDDETTLAGLSATTQCLPLYTILLALNVSTVDYFSLDVEGEGLIEYYF